MTPGESDILFPLQVPARRRHGVGEREGAGGREKETFVLTELVLFVSFARILARCMAT